jgi:hypothetical protein
MRCGSEFLRMGRVSGTASGTLTVQRPRQPVCRGRKEKKPLKPSNMLKGPSVTAGVFALGLLFGIAPRVASGAESLSPAGPREGAPVSSARVLSTLGGLPLHFDANRGQAGPAVQFLSRGPGFSLSLTARESVLSLTRRTRPAAGSPGMPPAVIRMAWKGANPDATAVGRDALPGKSNYLVGNDASKWITGVASFGKVQYRNLYPGVDLVFYGTGRQLEYDFILAPGVDPGVIRLSFSGEDSLDIDEGGRLILRVGEETIVQHAPVVYQEVSGTRLLLAGSYVRTGPHDVGFRVPVRDAARPLYLDPVLSFSTFLGGDGYDYARGIALDSQRNVYVTGYTNSSTFPGTAGNPGTDYDAFVTKISPAGAVVYSTYVGGSAEDHGYAIAVNSSGEAYITGRTFSSDFPTANAYQVTNLAGDAAFLTKLNAAGNTALYSSYLGGSSSNIGYGIAVDGAGRAYVVGGTASVNFPVTVGALQTDFGGLYDAFISKFDPTLAGPSSLVYSTYFGGTSWEYAYAVTVDGGGIAYLTGEISSGMTSREVLVLKVNATGSGLVYGTYFGGSADDYGYGIAIDGGGNAYVTGQTASSDFPVTAGAFQTLPGGLLDAFVAKLNSTGSLLTYSTYLGGGSDDTGRAIAVDASGNAYVTGDTSTNFPVQNPLPYTGSSSNRDAFVSELNPAGTGLVFSTRLGGNGNISGGDKGFAIAVDGSRSIYVAGQTDSTNFPTVHPIQAAQGDGGAKFDAFVSKINERAAAKFFTLLPCRVLDTRRLPNGPLAGPSLQPGATRSFTIPSAPCGVPADASSISVNATVTGPQQPGFLTMYPADSVRPLASSINFTAGQTRANNAILPLSGDGVGAITVFTGSAGAAQFILDVNGYFK